MDAEGELADLAAHFSSAPTEVFTTSPLYAALCPAVAGDRVTLELLMHRRRGQQPSYLLFGAVHYLLLAGAEHPVRSFYPSLSVGEVAAASGAGPVFLDFVHLYREELAAVVRSRLVQTNVVRRAVGLRFALWAIGRTCPEPVHLVEVGASAGIHLHVDKYRYVLGSRSFGVQDAKVTINSRWLGNGPPPDLDRVPVIASRTGVDLHPVDVTDPDQRRWLRALVWPENGPDADLLERALVTTAAAPPKILADDAIDVCSQIGRRLPHGDTRVAFHAATRMHVPPERRAAFDHAIDAMGEHGPLYHVWQEPLTAPHDQANQVDQRAGLFFHRPNTDGVVALAQIDGHGAWLAPT